MKGPVVVLIFAHREQLEWYEEVSLRQCARILSRHPTRLVFPRNRNPARYLELAPELEVDLIPPHWLQSYRAYNKLKIDPFLYRRYSEFEFMLTYELDSFVFRDELLDWCAAGWDYVGAPWFVGKQAPLPDAPPDGVGNSGFSLRRTRTMANVLGTLRYQQPLRTVIRDLVTRNRGVRSSLGLLTYKNNFFHALNDFEKNEDLFWCELVPERFPNFKLAPWDAARRFAFEANPSRLFREGGGELPFGCHQWMKYEPDFWRPHIEAFGYTLPSASKCEAVRVSLPQEA